MLNEHGRGRRLSFTWGRLVDTNRVRQHHSLPSRTTTTDTFHHTTLHVSEKDRRYVDNHQPRCCIDSSGLIFSNQHFIGITTSANQTSRRVAITMDEVVKKSIEAAQSKTRSSVPWTVDKPFNQPYYLFSPSDQKWQAFEPGNDTTAPDTSAPKIGRLALYSWNIDFMLPYPDSRMQIALRHLQKRISELDTGTASVIYLQESLETDVTLIASDPWVREYYALSDIGIENWQSGHYGTVTLIDRRLPISSCFRVHYSQTVMERDGLFVDLGITHKTVRLCNTHLESLALEPPRRPPQMRMVAKYMLDSSVHGAAVAGDFNAIQDFDRSLHSDNGLKDAYLELGGDEYDAEGGHTWGQQAATFQREQFGTSRMDKVFFCGELVCRRFERFGAGVELVDDAESKHIVELGFDQPWITDHLGVMAVFEVAATHTQSQARM